MEIYDLVILLGSQVKKEGNQYTLAPHTELKARAAGIAWQKGITKRFIISGGYNFEIRYTDNEILKNPDFSFEAFARGRQKKSEAQVIAEFLQKEYGIPLEAMFLEELSTTTEENAEILKILLKRTTFEFAGTFMYELTEINTVRTAILTLLYHMERALPTFKETGLGVEPLFAEDLLALEGESGIEKVCQYYSVPKGGKQWPVDKIRELLSSGRSIGELLEKPNEKISPLPEEIYPEEIVKRDPKTLWSPGDEKCQHEWVKRWRQEELKPQGLRHVVTALCTKCKREVFLNGNVIEAGFEYELEPDGSLGAAIPNEGMRHF